MGFQQTELAGDMIHDNTGIAQAFVKEWQSESTYVNAHTSGSTGTPKQVTLDKSDMILSAKATCTFFGINEHSHLLLPLSVDYIAGKMMIVRAIVSNADITIVEPSNNPFVIDIVPPEVNLVAIVPSQVQALVSASQSIRFSHVIVGGAPMSRIQEKALMDAGVNAWATYGMTETCSHVALRHISQSHYTALPGFAFETDNRGCLIVNHENMSFKRLHTNDMIQLLSPTTFIWLGRYDNVINSGGVKIHPEADEALLSDIIKDKCYYIAAKPHDKWGEVPVLVIEGADNGCAQQYLKSAYELLPKYHAPKDVVWIPEFERTSSGKIKRVRLL